jgi:hypothetical protein
VACAAWRKLIAQPETVTFGGIRDWAHVGQTLGPGIRRLAKPDAGADEDGSSAATPLAEALGTGLLVATVVGSSIMAESLTKDVALGLFGNTLPTDTMLVVLIAILGPSPARISTGGVTRRAGCRRRPLDGRRVCDVRAATARRFL